MRVDASEGLTLRESWSAVEQLGGSHCDLCIAPLQQHRNIFQAAPFLIVNVARFGYDVGMQQPAKRMDALAAPPTEHVGAFDYTLVGIVSHRGPHAGGGHYIGFVKEGDEWFECDDSHVHRCQVADASRAELQGLRTPTLYLYERADNIAMREAARAAQRARAEEAARLA